MFSVPTGEENRGEGKSDDHPIVLEGYRRDDFKALLKVIYYSAYAFCLPFLMGNSVTLQDTNGNRKLLKKRQDQKIDNVAALMDAYIAYKANKDQFE